MREFSDDDIPEYSILSHTWESEQEVSFQQWEDRKTSDIGQKSGFVKIESFRAQAARDGFEWVWVDTFVTLCFSSPIVLKLPSCCIDKTSSAELTEAINAMFRWYQNATACYTYLADVETLHSSAELAASRWFTRGWTLQELIAPKDVRFYSKMWEYIDTKANMCDQISDITGIDQAILRGGDLETVSVARRMSWASRRKTSRVEDMAYCLLGIFDVNLPLIYGEGHKAFQRLQEAIMLKTHDQSLFAWGKLVDTPSVELLDADQVLGVEPIPWKSPAERQPLLGLFAQGPELFQSSRDVEPLGVFSHELRRSHPPVLVSGGVLLGLVTASDLEDSFLYSVMYLDNPKLSVPVPIYLVALICNIKGSETLVGFLMRRWEEGYAGRTPELFELGIQFSRSRFAKMIRQWHIMKERPLEPRHSDIFYRRDSSDLIIAHASKSRLERITWAECDILRSSSKIAGDSNEYMRYNYKVTPDQGLRVSLGRSITKSGSVEPLTIKVCCVKFRRPLTKDEELWDLIAVAPPSTDESLHHSHIMALPCDSWHLELEGYPGVYIRVERKALGAGKNETVDVVDFFLLKGPDHDLEKVKRAVTSGCG